MISVTGIRKVDAFYWRDGAEITPGFDAGRSAVDGCVNSVKRGDFTQVTLGKKR
jgi:hypothetical protein